MVKNKKRSGCSITPLKNLYNRELWRLYLIVALLIVGCFLGLLFLVIDHNKVTVNKNVKIADTVMMSTPVPAPSVVPTPSPSVTPQPVYTGYCLKVPVIFYHHVEPLAQAKTEGHAQLTVDSGIFDTQMAYLSSHGYTTVSAEQLANALISKSGLPGKSIVVTADDGYSDFYTYAFPVLQKYHMVVSLAIPTGLLGNNGYMNWDQLKQMVGTGKIFVYNHTWSHYNLAVAAKDKAQYEISTAKSQLQSYLGKVSNVFFYPYGGVGNIALSVLGTNGYNVGFTTLPGSTQCDSFLMSLHRTRIGNSPLSTYGL